MANTQEHIKEVFQKDIIPTLDLLLAEENGGQARELFVVLWLNQTEGLTLVHGSMSPGLLHSLEQAMQNLIKSQLEDNPHWLLYLLKETLAEPGGAEKLAKAFERRPE